MIYNYHNFYYNNNSIIIYLPNLILYLKVPLFLLMLYYCFYIYLETALNSFCYDILNAENSSWFKQLIWACICSRKQKLIQYTRLIETLTTSCHDSQIW